MLRRHEARMGSFHSAPEALLPRVKTFIRVNRLQQMVVYYSPYSDTTTNDLIMIYGYIRVSTDKQSVKNQQHEIDRFCQSQGLAIDGWIEETISGIKAYDKRKLGGLLRKVRSGDLIICSELSRLGRSLFMIMEILGTCMHKGCRVYTVKEGYRLGEDIQSKVLAFAFGLSAEIERNLISQRTREALAAKKHAGIKLGRPNGKSRERRRFDEREGYIREQLDKGATIGRLAEELEMHRNTLSRYLREGPGHGPSRKE